MALTELRYRAGDTELVGQLARPAGPGPHPAVLIAHEINGIGDNARTRAQMLADLGYVALAGDVYGGGAYLENEAARPLMDALIADPDTLRARMAAGIAALRAVDGVDPARVAAIGYCFGGLCVLELARAGSDVAGVVSFHGLLTTQRPAAPGTIRARILVCNGDADPLVPHDQLAAFQAEMRAAKAGWQVINYGGALHAFTNPNVRAGDNPALAHDPAADRQSWAAMRTFLDEVIGSVAA